MKMRKPAGQGVTFGAPVTVTTLVGAGVNGDLGLGFRSNSFPQAVVNLVNGNIYVVYDDKGTATGDRGDIYFRQSTNGGATWCAAVKANDGTTNHDQWQPALAASPHGSKLGSICEGRPVNAGNRLLD